MSGSSAPGSPAMSGFFSTVRTWLRSGSNMIAHATEDLQDQAERPQAATAHPVRVLVVDDNPVNLMVMAAQFEAKGLLPSLAGDGAEAVALACEMHFDLIVMDLQMPVLDGLRATAAIRRFERAHARAAVPVIAYSLTPPGASVLAAHGLNGSLDKPCDDRELEDCLIQWCAGYRPLHSGPVDAGEHHRWQTARRP
jgi:CheY-like chemotaxis protein